MHDFLITIFLGLALFKLVDVLEDLVPGLTRVHTLATMVLAMCTVPLDSVLTNTPGDA